MTETTANLQLQKITKTYGGVVALREANFEAHAGEVHGLVGENGAGKSTLVKILSGAVQRDSGEILLDGRSLSFGNPGAAIRAGIGMVYQELSLLPDLTVAQNIFIGREKLDMFGGTSHRALRQRCYELFDRMGVDVADPDRTVNTLPLNQRQMVEIAKTVARSPRVIILDEATSALGHAQSDWLLRFTRQLAQEGRIIIYISHKLSQVRQVSDRITVFRNGRDVGTRAKDAASTEELVDLILGRNIGRLYPERMAEARSEPMLEVGHLRVGVRLKDVSFTLHKGEILGIAGLEGQGQEELFRGLFGVQRSHGELKLEGQPIVIHSAQDALNHNIGLALVPEDRATQGLLLPKSVSNNITLTVLAQLQRFGLINRSAEKVVVDRAIKQFSIKVADPADAVNHLSGGNQQKVLLAKLLATKPKVLMLYDSTRGVDVGTKAEIFGLLRELTAAGSSVLMYSTELEELINMCDRILVIRQGMLEVELTSGLINEQNIVRASMGEPITQTMNEEKSESIPHAVENQEA
jgi:ribose transport system ATP-binding protein